MSGCSCQVFRYVPQEHDDFFKALAKFDGVIARANPGQINAIPGGSQAKFDAAMTEITKKGIPVWSSPMVMQNMGAMKPAKVSRQLSSR